MMFMARMMVATEHDVKCPPRKALNMTGGAIHKHKSQ